MTYAAGGLGHVMIDGNRYEITRIRLDQGLLKITCCHHGPVRPVTGAMAAVFGPDGRGVCQSWVLDLPPHVAQLRPHDNVTVELPIRIDTLEAVPG